MDRVSRTPTATSVFSAYPMSSKIASRLAAARIGPEPMAKKSPTFTSHPAYWEAMQPATGWSVVTWTNGPAERFAGPETSSTRPSPAKQTSERIFPACKPPAASIPQSSTRAEATRCFPTRSLSAASKSSRETFRAWRFRFTFLVLSQNIVGAESFSPTLLTDAMPARGAGWARVRSRGSKMASTALHPIKQLAQDFSPISSPFRM